MPTNRTTKELRKSVLEELDWEPSIDASDIGVAVGDGVVTLSGTVPTYAEKRAAERAALRVAGVRGLANDIEVRLATDHQRTDSEIAKAAVEALERNIQVPSDAVKLKVADGWITLEGTVKWDYQRKRAERAVRYLMGVRGLTDNLNVKQRPTPNNIRDRIKTSLERRVAEQSDRIQVKVDDGKVTLSGTVPSWPDREDVESAVWSAPGVTNVENNLKVSREAYT